MAKITLYHLSEFDLFMTSFANSAIPIKTFRKNSPDSISVTQPSN